MILKLKKILILFVIFTCNINNKIQGQTNINSKENSTTDRSIQENRLKQKQKYLDENLREEKTLIKFDFYPRFSFIEKNFIFGGIRSSFAVEKKIIPALSILYTNNVGFGFSDYHTSWELEGDIELRCYYSLNKRIRDNIGANNFHNNYFSIRLNNCYKYTYSTQESYYSNTGATFKYQEWYFNPTFELSWGIQRRIGKWGYYDVGPFIGYERAHGFYDFGDDRFYGLYMGFNLKLGLGWGF